MVQAAIKDDASAYTQDATTRVAASVVRRAGIAAYIRTDAAIDRVETSRAVSGNHQAQFGRKVSFMHNYVFWAVDEGGVCMAHNVTAMKAEEATRMIMTMIGSTVSATGRSCFELLTKE